MNNEGHGAASTTHKPNTASTDTTNGDYSSNPFVTIQEGLKLFWHNGRQALAGVAIVEVVLAVVAALLFLGGCVLWIIIALSQLPPSGALTIGDTTGDLTVVLNAFMSQLPPQLTGPWQTLAGAPGVTIALATALTLLAMGVGTITQTIYFAYAHFVTTGGRAAKLGDVMGLALRRTGPLLAQAILVFAAIAVIFVVPSILLASLGPVVALYCLVILIFLLFASLRLSLASFALVAYNMGPIASLKYSWALTKKRTWEIIGLGSVLLIGFSILSLLTTVLQVTVQDSASEVSLFAGLFTLIVMSLLSFAVVVVLAHFFNRIRTATLNATPHKVNYGINIGIAVLAVIVIFALGAAETALSPTPSLEDYNLPTTQQDDPYQTLPGDEGTDQTIYDQFYNEPETPDDTPASYQ